MLQGIWQDNKDKITTKFHQVWQLHQVDTELKHQIKHKGLIQQELVQKLMAIKDLYKISFREEEEIIIIINLDHNKLHLAITRSTKN